MTFEQPCALASWRHELHQIRNVQGVGGFLIIVISGIGLGYVTTVIVHDMLNPILDILLTQGGSPLSGPLTWQQIVMYGIDVTLFLLLTWILLRRS